MKVCGRSLRLEYLKKYKDTKKYDMKLLSNVD